MIESIKRQLKQAKVIIATAWQKNLSFRFTVLTYRIGEIVETLVLILMWTAIYSSEGQLIKGFTLNEMITYVLIGNLCSVAVRNSLPAYISKHISEGGLSLFLTKPISYIKYVFINELGRIFLITILSLFSQTIVTLFFLDKIIVNFNPLYIIIIIMMVFFAFVIELLIGFLIGIIAFWTDEVDGIQTTIDRVKRFFSGGYFPLSLLPVAFVTVSTYLPFQYSFFIPASLYLKKIDLYQGIYGLGIQIIWIFLLSLILSIAWRRGLHKYEAMGS